MQLTRLVNIIEGTISEGTPTLRGHFRTQFPRWRILGVLIRNDVERQKISGPPSACVPLVVSPPDSQIWDHSVWQCFGALQFTCMDKTACAKRGCENVGVIACMCQTTKYCSEACKNKYVSFHICTISCVGLTFFFIKGCEGPSACMWFFRVIGECRSHQGVWEADNIAAISDNQGKGE